MLLPEQRSSMHLDTVLTMIDRDAFTIFPDLRGSLDPIRHPARPHRREDREARGSLRRDRPRARPTVRSGSSRPAAIATRPSASSGTTATTSSRSHPASSSPTSATSRRTRAFVTRESKSSRSPAPSSGGDAAALAACPARSSATPFRRRSDGEDRRRRRRLDRRRPGARVGGRGGGPTQAPLCTSCTPGWFR